MSHLPHDTTPPSYIPPPQIVIKHQRITFFENTESALNAIFAIYKAPRYMRFPISTSLLLVLQSRVNAGVGAFASTPLKYPAVSSAFIHRNNSNKHASRTSSSRTHASSFRNAVLKVTVSPDDVEMDMFEIQKAANASRSITTTSTKIAKFSNLSYVNTSELTKKKQHRVLFILGGPGAGKGTQSERIVDTYQCIHLSVGELLRAERKRGDASPHAELIESCLVAGKIVPVEISLNLLRNAMDEACSGNDAYGAPIFLVDGFPRNFDNLSGWTKEMPEYAAVIGSLVYDCPMDVLEQRILGRAETSGRSDDNLESARKRFKTFQQQTMPVVHALEEVERMEIDEEGMGSLHVQHVAGEGTVEEVWDATKDALNQFVRNDVLTANALLNKAIDDQDIDLYRQLCSDEFLKVDGEQIEAKDTFEKYEIVSDDVKTAGISIKNAKVEVQDGTKAVVTYDTTVSDADGTTVAEFRESRVWSHEKTGWNCVHFARKPLSEP